MWILATTASVLGPFAVPVAELTALGLLFLVVAALVNGFARDRRGRLRGVLSLLAGFALLRFGLAAASSFGGPELWWLAVASGLAGAWTLAHLAVITVFDVAIPRAGFRPHQLASDLALGAGYLVGFALVLARHGLEFSSVLAASTVFAAVLTVSLQATLGNVLGGVAVQLDGSIQPGQWLQLENGRQGRVRTVRWRYTVLETRDGDELLVPNASLLSSQMTFLGRRDGRPHPHRQWVYFHVDFQWPPAEVCRVVEEALGASPIPNVVAAPPLDCICLDLAREGRESFGYYAVRYFIEDLASDEPTSSKVRARVHAALRRAGIELARPAYTQFTVMTDDGTDASSALRRQNQAVSTLRALDLFAPLTEEEVRRLAEQVVSTPFTSGETMTRQGAVAHFLYLVERGACEVRVAGGGGEERVVARIEGPTFFGEMGLMTGEPRTASVVALTDVRCYRLDKKSFDAVIRARPELAAEVSTVLAARRVGLIAAQEGLDGEARTARERSEQARLVHGIRSFFGLDN